MISCTRTYIAHASPHIHRTFISAHTSKKCEKWHCYRERSICGLTVVWRKQGYSLPPMVELRMLRGGIPRPIGTSPET